MAYADINRVLVLAASGRSADPEAFLADIIGTLARAGAKVAAISALTSHLATLVAEASPTAGACR